MRKKEDKNSVSNYKLYSIVSSECVLSNLGVGYNSFNSAYI